MSTAERCRFDVDALREIAGEAVFARGEAYRREGRVALLSLGPERVLAEVAGSEDYRTALSGHGSTIDGSCSCPAFEDWGFCKHMVATALAANDADGADVATNGVSTLERIRDHLKRQSVDALAAMILDLAERDLALFRRLEIAAAATDTDDRTLEMRLSKAIDRATRTGAFVDYHEAAGWAAGVDQALDALADLAAGERAGLVLRLVDQAIDRIEEAIELIDDSDGHVDGLLARAGEIHLAAARTARPDPVELARDLFDREMDDMWETFAGAAALYADVLGEEGLAEYRRLATAAWEKLPVATGDAAKRHRNPPEGFRALAAILDFFAERDGDVEARIALRARYLSSQWSYLQLAEYCLAEGRAEEALHWAKEGVWVFEDDRPDRRLIAFTAERLASAGRKADAASLVERAFVKEPSLELYEDLRTFADKAARERVVALLEARLAGDKVNRWGHPADLLVSILAREKMYEAAWAAVRAHGASMTVKERLARASEAAHPREALEVYAARVDQLAEAGGNRSYSEAAAFVARMAELRSAAEQSAYVLSLKARFGRKRNLMKLLA